MLLDAVPDLSRKADRALHLMTKRLVRRLLQQPLGRLRELHAEGLPEGALDVVRELFGAGAASADAAGADEGDASAEDRGAEHE